MTLYLDSSDLIALASKVAVGDLEVRDAGLLDAAAHRPRAVLFDVEVYETLWLKAAALLDSIVKTRPMRENNWRLGWLAMVVFCDINGWWVDANDAEALELVRRISRDSVKLEEVAQLIKGWAHERSLED